MPVPIDEEVASALAAVAAAMRESRDPWWVIGSAAVALHGADTDVADIDLLGSERDAAALIAQLGLTVERLDPHPLFRSRIFARWRRADRDVEIMGGFAVADGPDWQSVEPATRVLRGGVFVPDRTELIAILARFGRPKDLARRRMLTAV
jgi:hypothetical protein